MHNIFGFRTSYEQFLNMRPFARICARLAGICARNAGTPGSILLARFKKDQIFLFVLKPRPSAALVAAQVPPGGPGIHRPGLVESLGK